MAEEREVALAAVAEDGLRLRHAAEALRADAEVVAAAVGQNGVALKFASDELRADRAIALAAVRGTWVALAYAVESIRNDAEIARIAIEQSGLALKDCSEELRADRDLVMAAVLNDGMALAYASEELRNDREIVDEAIDQTSKAFEHASEELRADFSLVCPTVRTDGSMLRYASARARADRDVVLDAVANYGMALASASEKCRADREVVDKAVSQCGAALAYASEELRNDDRIVRAAGREDVTSLEYASWEVRNDRELMLDLVDRDGRGLRWAADLRADAEVVKAAVRDCGAALAEASVELRNDKGIVMTAVKQDGRALLYASHALRGDREIVLAAVAQHGAALAHVLDAQICDPEICMTALSNDGMALAYVPEKVRFNREVVVAAVTQRGVSLQYAPYALRGDREVALAAANEAGQEAVAFMSLDLKRDADFVEFATTAEVRVPGALASKPRPLQRKCVLAKARRWLEPAIRDAHHVTWLEALPILRRVSPLSDFERAFTEPAEFVRTLSERPAEVAKPWAIACAKPRLLPYLETYGVAWEDMELVLQHVQLPDIRAAIAEPKQFLEELSGKRVGEAIKQFVIAQLRPGLEPLLPEGVPWQDARWTLGAIETLKELADFLETGTDLLMWKLVNGSEWPPAARYAIVLLRPQVSPKLPGDPPPYWDDFFKLILEFDDAGRQEMLQNLDKFILKCRMDPYTRPAKLWALAQLRPRIVDALEVQGNEWEDVLPMLEEMDTMRELQAALDGGVAPLLARLAHGPPEEN